MNQNTTNLQTPEVIGAPFEGGFYGGKIRIGLAICAIVWAPKAEGEIKGKWLDSYASVPGATSCFDSMTNTKAMAEAGSPLAKWALGLDINGHADWCIPARDVLEMGYRYLKPTTDENSASFRDGDNASSIPTGYPYTDESPAQTTCEAMQEGHTEAFEADWHWSSTQCSGSTAFSQYFLNGGQDCSSKSYEGRARAVRLIQLSS
jgi:hypothetical protein